MTAPNGTRLRKHSVLIAGHRTSVSLEDAFWEAFKAIAADRKQSLNDLVTEIDRDRTGSLSGAIRVFVLDFHRTRAPDEERP